ncbi:TPM domain-containing protein [uncultured Enterovirga sp.]|uniref:TPM domain-containing protein n=1 Tax=uncultured Enterovirga sp. TaxID=2026352 RepID=UPI0035CA15BB
MLSEEARTRIEAAVREAERGSSGEIVVVLARRAGSYKSVPLALGLAVALATPGPLILFSTMPAARIFAVQLAATLLAVFASAWAGIRAVPPALRRDRARAAALREFTHRGMADTRGRTGVLLYLAVAERYAEVVGDVTISSRVGEQEWRGVIEALQADMTAGRIEEALVAAIGRIGAILARHAPPDQDDRDELQNRVVLI